MSIIFKWEKDQLNNLLESCSIDDLLPIINKYFPDGCKVLEAGCGSGRWVKFLSDAGWDVTGIELSESTVNMVKECWPDINIIEGNVEKVECPDGYYDAVLSVGVVEHWIDGPQSPLKEMYRVIKSGGIAIISVPCFNKVRMIKKFLWIEEIYYILKNIYRYFFKGKKVGFRFNNRFNKLYKYYVYPAVGDFYEYRMSKEQFKEQVLKIGFKILDETPISQMDGIYHELNPFKLVVRYKDYKFYPSVLANFINKLLSRFPYFHNHMQVLVVTK